MLIVLALAGLLVGQTPTPDVPVIKAGLGSCTVDFTVKNAAGAPIQAAEIHVRIKYGAMGLRRMDLDLSTNAEGKARIEGLPDKARPFSYDIQKDGRKAVIVHDVAKVCRATHEVELK